MLSFCYHERHHPWQTFLKGSNFISVFYRRLSRKNSGEVWLSKIGPVVFEELLFKTNC